MKTIPTLGKQSLTLGHLGMGTGAVAPFDEVFDKGIQITASDIYEGKVDCLVVWGGADISPTIYNEPVGPRTGASERLSARDVSEVNAMKAAIDMEIPIIGICRGAQMLCALAGGKLVQDVQNHVGGDHWIDTIDGQSLATSSVHHQMMYPWDVDHKMIAWASHKRSKSYVGVDESKIKVEPEIVYFPKVKGLAIQGHPEFMDRSEAFVGYCNDLVKEYLL